jgi:hypothetical protein
MLEICTFPGCSTLTIGRLCLRHEPASGPRVFPRGRPHPRHDGERKLLTVTLPAAEKELVPDVVLMEGGA